VSDQNNLDTKIGAKDLRDSFYRLRTFWYRWTPDPFRRPSPGLAETFVLYDKTVPGVAQTAILGHLVGRPIRFNTPAASLSPKEWKKKRALERRGGA